jgi:hypothetical protein
MCSSDVKEKQNKEFLRSVADQIWRKIKGVPLPKEYTDQDVVSIWSRYWHKVMESEQ